MKNCCIAISATDPSSGAGAQLDVRLLETHNVHPISVITGITVQNIDTFKNFFPIPKLQFEKQLETALNDFPSTVMKVGMIGESAIESLSDFINRGVIRQKIILDPILGSSSGTKVVQPEAISKLFPYAHVVTPNIPELEVFLDMDIRTYDDMRNAIVKFYERYQPQIVLLKGGHLLELEPIDFLYDGNTITEIKASSIYRGSEVHGTGCFLSTSIAAYLTRDESLTDAIKKSKEDIVTAMKNACTIGHSHRKVFQIF